MAKTKTKTAPSGPWREGRPSFKAYYPEIIFLGVLTLASIALGIKWGLSAKDSTGELILAFSVSFGVPLLIWLWRGWHWLLVVYGTKYELRCDADNPRATTFLITRGILHRTTDSMHIGQIKDVRSEQSLIEKYIMGGIGTIVLYTSDLTDAVVTMKHMAEPSRVFNAFDDLRRLYWAKGGVQFRGSEVADHEDFVDEATASS